jgi:hypothetical protein
VTDVPSSPQLADAVDGLDYSPNGSQLVVTYTPCSVHADTIDVVDLKSGGVSRHTGAVGEARFTPDGNRIIYEGSSGLVERRLPDPGGDVRPDEPETKELRLSPGVPSIQARTGG